MAAQTTSNCHISPKCWQKISNTSICIQLTHVPQSSVSPTQRPKGAQTSSKCHTSPKCWQNIFNKKYMYSTDTCSPIQRPQGAQTPSNCQISPKCWQNISNTNICYIIASHMFLNRSSIHLIFFDSVSNCPRCQIVRGVKLSVFVVGGGECRNLHWGW